MDVFRPEKVIRDCDTRFDSQYSQPREGYAADVLQLVGNVTGRTGRMRHAADLGLIRKDTLVNKNHFFSFV